MIRIVLFLLFLSLNVYAEATKTDIVPADINRIVDVAEPTFSPDGKALVYSVSSANLATDQPQTDLWRVGFNGANRTQLTHTLEHSEWRPQWRSDGLAIAFLSDRGKDGTTQVWLLPAQGGEARQITFFDEGIEDFVFSPDGKQLAIIAFDPQFPAGMEKPHNPPPIVTDRYQFKNDESGYLGTRHKHLYLFDIAANKTTLLTSGDHDEQLPAWSPDGKTIAYVTKRGKDPDRTLNFDIYLIEPRAGASERQLTTFTGSDLDPYWETRPTWSPDSTRIAYLQSGDDRWIYYAPWQLAVIDVNTGKSTLPAPIDRCFYKPHWSPDGRSIVVLIEEAQVTHAERIELVSGKRTVLDPGNRFDYGLDVAANGNIVLLGNGSQRPYELAAVGPNSLRPLTDHNTWLAEKRLAPYEQISVTSTAGTTVQALLIKPHDWQPGKHYPTIVRVHGGPVYQFSHEFMIDWQTYAAAGYLVVAVNPRGSSGRGFDFSRAIYADWGNKDVQDVHAVVDHVVAMGLADPERLGVGGRSYGGILTDYLIASDTRFKAAVSDSGSANALAMYGHDEYIRELELELGTPWKNREAYDRVSYPFLHADKIKTPTLFQCAQLDFNVPCLGAEQMYQALRSQDVPTALVIYPGEHHALTIPSYLRDRLTRQLAWFDRFLKP